MFVPSVCLLLFLNHSIATAIENQHFKATLRNNVLDALEASVRDEDWIDKPCYDQILETFDNVRNFTLWATWVLDSMQLPIGSLYGSKYHLGNYDQCLKAPWAGSHPKLKTQYCLADVALSDIAPEHKDIGDPYGSTEEYINTLTKHKRPLSTISWGVCLPAVCTSHSVSTFIKILLQNSHLHTLASTAVVDVKYCKVAGEENNYTYGVYVFWVLLLSLFVTALYSTWYLSESRGKPSESLMSKLTKSFCFKKNALDLVKDSREDIPTVHGVRALTAILIMYSHQIYFGVSGPIFNGLDVDRAMDFLSPVIHSDLLTDTFLMMSGMLLAKGLFDKWDKPENPFLALWKRYLRLLPPVALMVFYISYVSIHTGSGPVWHTIMGYEAQTCQKNGWLSLLMLNNYIKSSEMCYIILWYVPADFQLTALGMFLFYIYRYHPRVGRVVVASAVALAILLPGVVTYWYRLPATIIYTIETMINIRQDAVFTSTYIQSQYRIGSYLVGMALGYVLSTYKVKDYRKTISKKLSLSIFVCAFVVGLTTMAAGGVFYTRAYNVIEAALFASTNRIIFASAISVFIVISEYGELPLITSFMSWSVFVPLSRLSYGLYLTHPAVLQRNTYAARTPNRSDLFTMFTDSLGVTLVGYLLSLAMWLLVQAPASGIINILMNPSKSGQETNKVKDNNQSNVECQANHNGKTNGWRENHNGETDSWKNYIGKLDKEMPNGKYKAKGQ